MKNLRIRTSFSIALAVKCRLVQVTKMGKNRRGHAMGGGGGFLAPEIKRGGKIMAKGGPAQIEKKIF